MRKTGTTTPKACVRPGCRSDAARDLSGGCPRRARVQAASPDRQPHGRRRGRRPNNRKPYFVRNAAAGGLAVTVSSVRPKSNRPDRENPVSTTDHEEIENVLLQAAQSVILIAVPVVVPDGKNQW